MKRYETCINCGRTWNVSRRAPLGWYVCPSCAAHLAKKAATAAGEVLAIVLCLASIYMVAVCLI